jgi:heme-degrading monooxygenase HmoA
MSEESTGPEQPGPPYTAVIFTSTRTEGDHGYAATAQRMEKLAAEQPGYLGFEGARNPDGTGVSASYWRSAADAQAWKRVAEHLLAQRRGMEEWYSTYTVRVATVEREYSGPVTAPGDGPPGTPPAGR